MSLERAREYDRVGEWLATKNTTSFSRRGAGSSPEVKYGIEGRRAQFQKDSYRQPVLTRPPMDPKNYRKQEQDPEAEICRTRLQDLLSKNCISSSTIGIHSYNQESMELEKDSNHTSNIV